MKKAFLFSIIVTLASVAISIFFKTLASSLYSKERLALFFSAVDVVALFMLFFIGFRASMSVSYARGVSAAQILAVFRLFVVGVCLFGFVSSFLFLKYVGFFIDTTYLFLLFVSFGFYAYFSNQLSMYRLYFDINVTSILEPLASLIWFYALYYTLFTQSIDALFLSSIAGMSSVSLYIYFRKYRLYEEPPFTLHKLNPDIKVFIKNSMLGGAEFMFGLLIIYFATLFVGYKFSLELLGDFQVVVKSFFLYFIAIFVFPIVKFMLPELSLLVARKDFISIKKLNIFAFRYSLASGVILFTLCLFLSAPTISWLFGSEYASASEALTALSAAIFFVCLNTYQVALLKSLDKFFLSASVRAFGSFLFLFFVFAVYSVSPTLEGVSVALTLSYASMSAISYYLVKKELKKSLKN